MREPRSLRPSSQTNPVCHQGLPTAPGFCFIFLQFFNSSDLKRGHLQGLELGLLPHLFHTPCPQGCYQLTSNARMDANRKGHRASPSRHSTAVQDSHRPPQDTLVLSQTDSPPTCLSCCSQYRGEKHDKPGSCPLDFPLPAPAVCSVPFVK